MRDRVQSLVVGNRRRQPAHRRDLSLLLRPPAAARRRAAGRRSAPASPPCSPFTTMTIRSAILKGGLQAARPGRQVHGSIARRFRGSATPRATKQTPEDLARAATDPISKRLAVIYERYQAKLRESNALDFDDLLLEAVRLLAHDAAHAREAEPALRIRDGGRVSGHQSQPV